MFYKRFIKKVSDEDGMVQHGEEENKTDLEKDEVGEVADKFEAVAANEAANVAEDEDLDDEEESEHEEVSQGEEDPLGHDYDWEEEGDNKLPWQSRIELAKEFFKTEILYRYDILEEDVRKRVKGSYRIELKGDNGGVWTLSLDEDLNIENRKENADIVLAMQHGDFLGIVNGDINPQIAILANKVEITGDVEKALAFQGILAPTNS